MHEEQRDPSVVCFKLYTQSTATYGSARAFASGVSRRNSRSRSREVGISLMTHFWNLLYAEHGLGTKGCGAEGGGGRNLTRLEVESYALLRFACISSFDAPAITVSIPRTLHGCARGPAFAFPAHFSHVFSVPYSYGRLRVQRSGTARVALYLQVRSVEKFV